MTVGVHQLKTSENNSLFSSPEALKVEMSGIHVAVKGLGITEPAVQFIHASKGSETMSLCLAKCFQPEDQAPHVNGCQVIVALRYGGRVGGGGEAEGSIENSAVNQALRLLWCVTPLDGRLFNVHFNTCAFA